jgi:hypothetical protein
VNMLIIDLADGSVRTKIKGLYSEKLSIDAMEISLLKLNLISGDDLTRPEI